MPSIPNSTGFGTFQVQKDVTSSAILTSDTNIIQAIGNGLLIDEVVVRTDATGLAGGTNLQLKADGVIFYSTAVSGLGANAVVDLRTATVKASKITVPPGTKYISISSTVGACTGAGVATVTLKFQKLDSNSTALAM